MFLHAMHNWGNRQYFFSLNYLWHLSNNKNTLHDQNCAQKNILQSPGTRKKYFHVDLKLSAFFLSILTSKRNQACAEHMRTLNTGEGIYMHIEVMRKKQVYDL